MSFCEKMLLAGFGGQGILAAGKIFADACLTNGLNASWLPAYGPEMRGGTCNCQVVISDGEIISPVCSRPTCMLIMNQQSMDYFEEKMINVKQLVINTSLVTLPEGFHQAHPDIKCIAVDASNIAIALNNVRVANMVMLGALSKHNDMLGIDALKESIRKIFQKKSSMIDLNIKAIEKGYFEAVQC